MVLYALMQLLCDLYNAVFDICFYLLIFADIFIEICLCEKFCKFSAVELGLDEIYFLECLGRRTMLAIKKLWNIYYHC